MCIVKFSPIEHIEHFCVVFFSKAATERLFFFSFPFQNNFCVRNGCTDVRKSSSKKQLANMEFKIFFFLRKWAWSEDGTQQNRAVQNIRNIRRRKRMYEKFRYCSWKIVTNRNRLRVMGPMSIVHFKTAKAQNIKWYTTVHCDHGECRLGERLVKLLNTPMV